MSETIRTRARAVVQLTIEIQADGVWGGECPIDQVYRQAKESVLTQVTSVLTQRKILPRLIGEPIVRQIITEEERT